VEIGNLEIRRCISVFRDVQLSPPEMASLLDGECALDDESEVYALAKGYFDLKEFDRCAFFSKDCKQPRNRFIHFYSRFFFKFSFFLTPPGKCDDKNCFVNIHLFDTKTYAQQGIVLTLT
jgi:hypothetical protein